MKIAIDRNEQWIDCSKIIIKIGDNDFRISVNKFDDLIINKYGGVDGSIHITPSVSNEIQIN